MLGGIIKNSLIKNYEYGFVIYIYSNLLSAFLRQHNFLFFKVPFK